MVLAIHQDLQVALIALALPLNYHPCDNVLLKVVLSRWDELTIFLTLK